MEHATPLVEYLSIKIANTDILLSSTCRASFKPPYNKIEVQLKPTTTSLSYYEVRVTKADEVADIGVGKLAYWDANISANKIKTFSIEINNTNFSYELADLMGVNTCIYCNWRQISRNTFPDFNCGNIGNEKQIWKCD